MFGIFQNCIGKEIKKQSALDDVTVPSAESDTSIESTVFLQHPSWEIDDGENENNESWATLECKKEVDRSKDEGKVATEEDCCVHGENSVANIPDSRSNPPPGKKQLSLHKRALAARKKRNNKRAKRTPTFR